LVLLAHRDQREAQDPLYLKEQQDRKENKDRRELLGQVGRQVLQDCKDRKEYRENKV